MANKWLAGLTSVLAAVACQAHAQTPTNCSKFKWDIARERGWILASTETLQSGGSFAFGPKGYKIQLSAGGQLHFAAPPERAPQPGRFGAILKLQGLPKPGIYQIALSNEAWLDVIANGKRLKSVDFSGQKNCPGVRKSVRFNLKPTQVILQISNAKNASISIAVAPAP